MQEDIIRDPVLYLWREYRLCWTTRICHKLCKISSPGRTQQFDFSKPATKHPNDVVEISKRGLIIAIIIKSHQFQVGSQFGLKIMLHFSSEHSYSQSNNFKLSLLCSTTYSSPICTTCFSRHNCLWLQEKNRNHQKFSLWTYITVISIYLQL